jgi:hypothetical protein|tara:strand:- start:302 stop:826 length:525 start_codon:yes stop_codon:yes gene_type:complete
MNMCNLNLKDWSKKAKEYEVSAEKNQDRVRESFDRCDTDGFLSQWAMGRLSELDNAKKELCLKKGLHNFIGLYLGTRRIKAKKIFTEYGATWLLHKDEKSNFNDRSFLPFNAGSGRGKILNSFGLKELNVTSPAWCKFPKGGGYYSSIVYFRFGVDNQWGENDKLVKVKKGGRA